MGPRTLSNCGDSLKPSIPRPSGNRGCSKRARWVQQQTSSLDGKNSKDLPAIRLSVEWVIRSQAPNVMLSRASAPDRMVPFSLSASTVLPWTECLPSPNASGRGFYPTRCSPMVVWVERPGGSHVEGRRLPWGRFRDYTGVERPAVWIDTCGCFS